MHIDEQIIFNNANEALRNLQIENLHMKFKVETIANDGEFEYLQVYNPSMYRRSAIIRHNIERVIGKNEKFEATVNG